MGLTKITESVVQRFSKWLNVNSTTGAVTSVVPDLIGSNTTLYPSFACRAWVNFDGSTAANLTGSFSQLSSTTVTITVNEHGLIAGHSIFITFSATLTSAVYTVTSVIDTNRFTITTTTGTSSGTVTLNRRLIRASGNVSNVSYNSTGNYTINFNNLMPDTNYCATGSCRTTNFPNYGSAIDSFYVYTTGSVRLVTVEARSSWSPAEAPIVSVAIFR
jgi:hypothetical protein